MALRQFKRAYDEAFHGVMARYALTRNEVGVILFLANQPSRGTARDIVELRGMTKSHVCQSIESLAARGLP